MPGPISSGRLNVYSGNLLRFFLAVLCELFIAEDLRDYFSVPGSSKRFFPPLNVLGWVTVFLTPEAYSVLGVSNLFLTELFSPVKFFFVAGVLFALAYIKI